MPIYDYECSNCNYRMVDVYQSFTSDPLTVCDNCKESTLNRVIFCPHVFVKGEVRTLGQLAEKNSKKMGKLQVEEKILKDKESKKVALKEAKNEINSKIGKMTEVQKRRYIEDGKI